MKPQGCRSYLLAIAAGAASWTGAAAQESPSLSAVMQAPRPYKSSAASPEAWIETVRGGEKSSVATRSHAVGALGATIWQADAEIEEALIVALRTDPSDKVRTQVAAVFGASRYLTPKAHDALQLCTVGSGRDGFAGERSPTVKAQAAQALQRHPTSGNPARIATLQRETAAAKRGRPASTASAKTHRRDGAEEASPPETLPELPPSLGRPVPVDLPAAPIPTVPGLTVPAPATPAFKTNAMTPPAPAVSPVKATTPPPPLPTTPIAVDRLPLPPAPKVVDRGPPAIDMSRPIQPGEDSAMTLRERRAELREMGLKDPTVKMFTEIVGAPPPTKNSVAAPVAVPSNVPDASGVMQASATSAPPSMPAAAPAPRGFLGRWFGGRSPAPATSEATPRPAENLNATPITNGNTLRLP